ncbi:hypothetical protein IKP13_05370 [bacterium]|nr:hypothetical protein [bacterium]
MFASGYWAKIWEIKDIRDKYTDARISTSVKNKQTDKYEQDFGAFVRLVGQAHEQIQYLSAEDRFKIIRCGVTNKYDKDKKTTYTNYVIFEIEAEDPADPIAEDNPFLES